MDSTVVSPTTNTPARGTGNDTRRKSKSSELATNEAPVSKLLDQPLSSIHSTPASEGKNGPVCPVTELQQKGLSLTEEQKEKLMSLLVSDKLQCSNDNNITSKNETSVTQTSDSETSKEKVVHLTKPPSPSIDMHICPEAQKMFAPIAPAGSPQSTDSSRNNQISTPTFIPIPVAVPAMNASPVGPMWYMPAGVIPYGHPGSPYTHFVPIDPSVTSSQPSDRDSDVSEPSEGEHRIKNSSIQKKAHPNSSSVRMNQDTERKTTKRSSSTPSRLPRPTWHTSAGQKSRENKSTTMTENKAPPSRRRSLTDSSVPKPRARTPPPSLGRSSARASTPPRSQTPPVYWTRPGVDMGNSSSRRPMRQSTGSMPSLRQTRPSSPNAIMDSPMSRNSSGNSSPLGSRSSSPVSLLVSKFEEMSQTPGENTPPKVRSKSVSSLLSKFGSSSLVPEDRMTKGQFKPNVSLSSANSPARTGPLKTASGTEVEHSFVNTSFHGGDLSASAESVARSREIYRTGSDPARSRKHHTGDSLSEESMQRLSASLEALFRGRDSPSSSLYEDEMTASEGLPSSVVSSGRWSSLGNLSNGFDCSPGDRGISHGPTGGTRMSPTTEIVPRSVEDSANRRSCSPSMRDRISSSRRSGDFSVSEERVDPPRFNNGYQETSTSCVKENREDTNGNRLCGERPRGRSPDTSIRKTSLTNEYAREDRVSTAKSEAVSCYPAHHSNEEKTVGQSVLQQQLLETEPVRESIRTKSKPYNLVLTPEKDTTSSQSSHPIPSPHGMFEIPVNMAIMDSRNSGSSTPLTSPLSPSSGYRRDSAFAPGTLRNVSASPLSPGSLKDYKPTNFFRNTPLGCNMEPERDMNPVPNQTDNTLQRTPETRVKPGPVPNQTDNTLQRTPETRVKPGPVEGRPSSPGKSAFSSGKKEQEYVKRFERRVSRSGQSDKEPDSPNPNTGDTHTPHGSTSDSKSNSGTSNPASPKTKNLQVSNPLSVSAHSISRKSPSPTPTSRDFVAYSSPMLKSSGNPRHTVSNLSDSAVSSSNLPATKRNSLPGGHSSDNSRKDTCNLSGGTLLSQSSPSLAMKGFISGSTTKRTSPQSALPSENALPSNSSRDVPHPTGERFNPHIRKRMSLEGSAGALRGATKDHGLSKDNVNQDCQTLDEGRRLDVSQERKPNRPFPQANNTRTPKPRDKHLSAPTSPTAVGEYKIPSLPFARRQSSPATSTLINPRTYTHKAKTSSNPSTPISTAHNKGNFPLFSPGSRPPSSESLTHTSHPGSPRHSWKGSEGNVASEGSGNNPSSPEISNRSATYLTRERNSSGSSTGSSPFTSPPGSFTKSRGSGPLSPTLAQVFDYSRKRGSGSTDLDIFYKPTETGVLEADRSKTCVPSTSFFDSGINQSETDELKGSAAPTHRGTQPPLSPKLPTGLNFFYEPGEGRGDEKREKTSDTSELPSPTKSVSQPTKNISTDVRRQGSSETKKEPHRSTKARHSSSSGEESARLLTKKSSSGSSRDRMKLNSLGDSASGRNSARGQQISSSSLQGEGDRSKGRPEKSPGLPESQSPRPESISALSRRPPSPGKVDSKELLGQLVRKVLTSAAAKQGTPPSTSFTDKNTTPPKDRDKSRTSPSGKVSNPFEGKLVAKPDETTPRLTLAMPRKASLDKDRQKGKESRENTQGSRQNSSKGSGKTPNRGEASSVVSGQSASDEPSIVSTNASTVESPVEVRNSQSA